MKLLAILLTACVVLAAAQAAMAVLAVLLVAWVVWGLFVCPREMLGLTGFFALVGLIQVEPLACLGVLALMIVAKMMRRR